MTVGLVSRLGAKVARTQGFLENRLCGLNRVCTRLPSCRMVGFGVGMAFVDVFRMWMVKVFVGRLGGT